MERWLIAQQRHDLLSSDIIRTNPVDIDGRIQQPLMIYLGLLTKLKQLDKITGLIGKPPCIYLPDGLWRLIQGNRSVFPA